MTITVGGAGGLVQLAPDLDFPSKFSGTTIGYVVILGIDAVGSLTTALSLTGKHAIDLLAFDGITAEEVTVKLTVDGVVIWNSTFTAASSIKLFGSNSVSNSSTVSSMICNDSLLLEIQTTADNSINLNYMARPIL